MHSGDLNYFLSINDRATMLPVVFSTSDTLECSINYIKMIVGYLNNIFYSSFKYHLKRKKEPSVLLAIP